MKTGFRRRFSDVLLRSGQKFGRLVQPLIQQISVGGTTRELAELKPQIGHAHVQIVRHGLQGPVLFGRTVELRQKTADPADIAAQSLRVPGPSFPHNE